MLKKYYDADVDWAVIAEKTVAVIGYGSQGRAQAQNLRDSGLAVIVGVRPGKSFEAASLDGFTVMPVCDAVKAADVVAMLVPDESAAEIFRREILPWTHDGQAIVFAHGFTLHYGQIIPPPNLDVVMVAPKGVGPQVRELYLADSGVPSIIAVHQDVTGNAKETALAFAKGIGSARSVIMESSCAEETETDLFGEQAVICGGVVNLMKAAYDTLVEAGYEPEIAYYECMHSLKLIAGLLSEGGFTMMHDSVSKTAGYGGLTRGPRVIGPEAKTAMKEILAEIRSGTFAREWLLENQVNRPQYTALVRLEKECELERVGGEVRRIISKRK
ncbi:ketol-acid reductoisomerase [Methanorbis rubei]|uniref:Ketol-acid reductoisomerase (NADP(+)) n=1 Tax=Methanorbis rubei TaxID=3028300 RepID=A0AAE4MF03_9EURY|nr:Ketol-acid reductoisomerase (NADP(+)) [Methanocorpusculaceae archaeon Cs1]